MNTLKSKSDYKHACAVVKSIIDDWDPYALLENGAPSDEFEGLASLVVAHIPRIRSTEDATAAISVVFSQEFEPELFRPEDCHEVGDRLYSRLIEEGFI
ncbi:MAG: hypothetical protein U9Q19_02235 [Pseudomonadota bacterium]|nr:hypothetical protein [Pseudomonadota bacterium]